MKKIISLLIITILIFASGVRSQELSRFFPESELVKTGIYYYPEHWDESQWERDIKKIGVMEAADLTKYKFVIIPAYEMADSSLVKKWNEYAEKGGHLIITCRTAVKNRVGHFWEGETAAPIIALIGAHVIATDMLSGNSRGDIVMNSTHYKYMFIGVTDFMLP